MARPKSEEKQLAILNATSFLIARYGLTGSPTSLIAKQAGVSEGTIFHYFSNKEKLLNQLYLHIKSQLASDLKQILKEDYSFKDYLWHIWEAYIRWGCRNPNDSKTLNQLLNAGILSPVTLEQVKTVLPQLDIGLTTSEEKRFGQENDFVEALFIALATTTIEFSIAQPKKKTVYLDRGFSLLWKMYENDTSS
ncbi:TetR/AcrR family transcriptional regulator [Streptococcus macacae]|uniref:Transcriptional regulator, TetR family n=1 Tax=Streptococcus macacae NCTC 11558 TaxID=764298 RepID=G5JYU2_9STRE|nr:TetR/AcrR family transcriptional regulator [Streptococcus macacae]EHJ53211.1 transcriptional regulator, TetR family [Streptococcus macacae NCTC 11558]SUN78199.1 HTH-type transcriptional repressor Bm3R1 [Streptococcus macacae NCTC 11558]